jgi:hypothetical protein
LGLAIFLQTTLVFATIERFNGIKCGNDLVVHQGRTDQVIEIFAHFSDLVAQSVAVSGSGVSASIAKRHNGPENHGRGYGNIGSVEIRFNVSSTAAAGNRTVTVRNAEGQAVESFTMRVIARASVTNTSVASLSGPFRTVDVTFDGSGLSNAFATVTIKRDQAFRDAAGANIPGSQQVFATASVNSQTNSNSRAVVTLNFNNIDLTQVTVEIALKSTNACSGLLGFSDGLKRTVAISAPLGTNFVKDVIFDRNNKTYKVGDVVSVTVRLNRPVPQKKGGSLIGGIGKQTAGENVFWTLLPSNAFEQAGPTGTPFNANAHHNTITVATGNQTATITFKVKSCPGSGLTNTVKLVTWKPDAFNDTAPNRKEFSFTIDCQQ